ncbi:hypothetical protein FB479_109220 [Brevibacillus sp. AG162]|uniref:hypothetical protein n=1 Tax=Brevibacillus sp. AG162 TaxID=2572910 RepID=UPI0011530E95|nr:hypothetical protein [Brevibacillus sp. AG162]TQK53741.1 hypothetical protein FB479_109220 [Brevibacillus sp. AG162]
MKKIYGIVTVAALVVGIGSAWIYQEGDRPSSKSFALAKIFKSAEDIANDSKLIVNATIPNEYKEEMVGELKYFVYQVKVNKVYNNLTNQKIEDGDTIELYRLIGIDMGKGKDIVNIVEQKNQDIDKGDYLLFLNGGYVETLGKEILVPNTPNQLFMASSSKGITSTNSSKVEYKNVFESDAIPSIHEEELLNAIK